MDRRQNVVYGDTAAVVEFYPPQWTEGAPSAAATYRVFAGGTPNTGTAEFTGTATADPVSTTVSVVSGYSQSNRKLVSLAATTNIGIGKQYILANAGGQREIVIPAKVTSGASVTAQYDLAYDYPITTSTFLGFRQYFTIDSTFVQTEGKVNEPELPYRVEWTYTIAGVSRRHWTYFDLVHVAKQHNVTAEDLMELWPDLGVQEWSERRGQKFRYIIDAAFERVQFDCKTESIEMHQLRDGQYLDELVRQCALMLIAEAGARPGTRDPELWVVERQKRYRDDFLKAISFLKVAVDKGASGAITPDVGTIWLRR